MSNLMSRFKLQNHVSRNGFDLSTRNAFTAKIGELLPTLCEECLPGDKFKINLSHFARTQPLTSPAYIRIKEYYDFIYVPTRLLWKPFDQFINQMPNNIAASSSVTEVSMAARHPYFTVSQLHTLLNDFDGLDDPSDMMGFDLSGQGAKLLSYLNYGDFTQAYDSNKEDNNALNPFPLLAYQKAYCDIYRFDQWENPSPHTFNIDYMSPGSQIVTTYISQQQSKNNFLTLRYANYPKDMFMGLLPNSQFGDVSVVASVVPDITGIFASQSTLGNIAARDSSNNTITLGASGSAVSYRSNIDSVFNFSILALRQAEFLQKWKEVAQTAKQDYRDQIKAHWNVNVSKARANVCEYLGGISSQIKINGEVNTNLNNATTIIKGTAMSAATGTIDFDVPEHGYILCIYHAAPILDYSGLKAVAPVNFKTMATDYAIPEMDKTGMALLPTSYLIGHLKASASFIGNFMGYGPRYIDYKTDVDRCHGAFTIDALANWVAPFDDDDFGSQVVRYFEFSKIRPQIFDDVFGVQVNSDWETDQLLCNASFDVKCVRNLDVNGMPY